MDRYLTPADYSIQTRSEIAALVSQQSEVTYAMAETARVNYMKGHFARRFDVSQIFFAVSKFDPALTYAVPAEGQPPKLVYFKKNTEADTDYKVYKVLSATAAGESPETTPAKWELFTDRDPFVILMLVDLVLYDLHSKHARRLMPDIVIERYDDAKAWVEAVGDGTINHNLPLLPEDDQPTESDIRFNSHPAEDQRW
jgi:hypothetical protein